MDMRLYKVPFRDPLSAHLVRLLFEGNQVKSVKKECFDFYLYVWIDNRFCLQAFQVIADEKVAVNYSAPEQISFGRISPKVIYRGITDKESAQERKNILKIMHSMKNQHFQSLLHSLWEIASGEKKIKVYLTTNEKEYLLPLLGK